MDNKEYSKLVSFYTPKESLLKNILISFLVGGLLGLIGNFLMDMYSYAFDISSSDASTLMIITLIFVTCLLTSLGFFDKLVTKCRCGLIIPITGFAHAMMSASLEYRKEGFVTGIGTNMFKLAGSVIIFGIVSAFIFGFIKFILIGVL